MQRHTYDPEGRDHDTEDTPLTRFDRHFRRIGHFKVARPLVVDVVQGLACSAAVALLVSATERDPLWAEDYLLILGIGTSAGMILITM